MEKSLNQRYMDFNRAWVRILVGLSFALGLTSAAEGKYFPPIVIPYSEIAACDGYINEIPYPYYGGPTIFNPYKPSPSLDNLVACIVAHMPGKNTNGFVVPDAATLGDWQNVVNQMLGNQCDIPLPASLSGYSNFTFLDAGKQYCVLMETDTYDTGNNGYKVKKGWGTVIVNGSAKLELSIQVPHPIYEQGTEAEGIGVFKGVQARSFIMAGTHRDANPAIKSICEPWATHGTNPTLFDTEADAGHNNLYMPFQSAVQALLDFYQAPNSNFVAIQFHGHAASAICPGGVNVHMTYGVNQAPTAGDSLLTLQSKLNAAHQVPAPAWVVTVPMEPNVPVCTLNGTDNVQGRLLNNVLPADVCTTSATSPSGRFIHIEQLQPNRKASDWIASIEETWPLGIPFSVAVVGYPQSKLAHPNAQFPDVMYIGSAVTFRIAVINNGPSQATGVTLTDTLPPGLVFASSPDTDCIHSGAAVSCRIGDLASGATARRTVVASAVRPGALANSVCASVADPRSIISGNCDSWTTVVELPAQFSTMFLDLESLLERGQLRAGPGNALLATLQAAAQQLERGGLGAAVYELTAFIDQVDALQRNRELDGEWAAALVDQAEGAIAQIRGDRREPHSDPGHARGD